MDALRKEAAICKEKSAFDDACLVAAERGDLEALLDARDAGSPVSLATLEAAAAKGHLPIVEHLYSACNLPITASVLHAALRLGQDEVATFCLRKKAAISALSMSEAVASGNFACVKLIFDAGIEIEPIHVQLAFFANNPVTYQFCAKHCCGRGRPMVAMPA